MRQSGQTNYALARLSKEKFNEHIKNQREEVRSIVNHADALLASDDVVPALQRYTAALRRAQPLTFLSRESHETSLESEIEEKRINLQTDIQIEMLSGNSQRGIYGEALADALVVQVSYKGEPLAKFPLKATYNWGTGRLKSKTAVADGFVHINTDAEGKGHCWVDVIRAISGENHIRITTDG